MWASSTNKRAAALCLAGSGACALIYQIAWLRRLDALVGDHGAAAGVLLALFMGGGGVGGFLLGRRVERAARPFLAYGLIELGVAAAAFASPSLLERSPAWAVVALALPVVLLGGTLPAAARIVTGDRDVGRKGLAAICGLHTLGAVLGALACELLLLEALGPAATVRAAALVHALLALTILAIALREAPLASNAGTPASPLARAPVWRSQRAWVLPVAFVTGFVFFLAEIGWTRATGGAPGASFGVVLAWALGGLALGGVAYAWAGPERPTVAHLAGTCTLEAIALLLPAVFLWGAPVDGAQIALLVLPASLVAGWQYPMLLALKGRGAVGVSADSGDVGAANTLGSILGALGGAFLFGGGALWAMCGVGLVILACSAAFASRGT